MKSQFNHPVLSSNVVSLMVDMFTINIPFPPSGFFGQKTSVTDALSLVVLPLDRPEKIAKFKVFTFHLSSNDLHFMYQFVSKDSIYHMESSFITQSIIIILQAVRFRISIKVPKFLQIAFSMGNSQKNCTIEVNPSNFLYE